MGQLRECVYNHPAGTRCPMCADWPYAKGGAEDWLRRRKLEVRTARMMRFIDMLTQPKPIGAGFLVSKEADLIRQALADIEARWGDRETADAMENDEEDTLQ